MQITVHLILQLCILFLVHQDHSEYISMCVFYFIVNAIQWEMSRNQQVREFVKFKIAPEKDGDAVPMRNSTTASQGTEPRIVSILLAPKASFINYKPVSPFLQNGLYFCFKIFYIG